MRLVSYLSHFAMASPRAASLVKPGLLCLHGRASFVGQHERKAELVPVKIRLHQDLGAHESLSRDGGVHGICGRACLGGFLDLLLRGRVVGVQHPDGDRGFLCSSFPESAGVLDHLVCVPVIKHRLPQLVPDVLHLLRSSWHHGTVRLGQGDGEVISKHFLLGCAMRRTVKDERDI
ncbi:hypothetical protein B0H67DRAFT_587274 [Lasiosphaeris hirsuta]|uniref:Uncharacterized protein n=1 Tax=Lasiosphaeris hirsuta TaxID=260670 RepID=A0AA40A0Z9_9PEZI|nr:hypothetical protein B0H67DRAFT_587274 [Lasiosphaeris hirsuta]